MMSSNNDLRFEVVGNRNVVTGLSFLNQLDDIQQIQDNDWLIRGLKRLINKAVPTNKWGRSYRRFARYAQHFDIVGNIFYYG